VIVVGSGIQVFLVKMIFLDGLASRIPVFLRKGKTSQNGHSNVRLHRGKRYGNKQSCEDIVTGVVSLSVLSLHVCA
jgi:hypothetical protein